MADFLLREEEQAISWLIPNQNYDRNEVIKLAKRKYPVNEMDTPVMEFQIMIGAL